MKIAFAFAVAVTVTGALILSAGCGQSGTGGNIKREFSDADYERHAAAKLQALERILGSMHKAVGHSIIPFHLGGALDMYYFPNRISGTGFATMELIEPDGTGPKPNDIGTYELVAFTRIRIPEEQTNPDENSPFHKIERRMCLVLSTVARYSYESVLNPGETCEVPSEEGEPTTCLILDQYPNNGSTFEIDGKTHLLLLCVEIFRSEMEYAMKNGSAPVLRRLKEKGYYPYSDLDREPVF